MITTVHKLHPRNKFAPAEDQRLRGLVQRFGEKDWQVISQEMPGRNTRQCRERWINYLSPDIMSAPWSEKEDNLLQSLYNENGSKWVKIAKSFPHRTDISVKNRWMVIMRHQRKKNEKKKKNEKQHYLTPKIERMPQSKENNKEAPFENWGFQLNEKEFDFDDFFNINAQTNLNNMNVWSDQFPFNSVDSPPIHIEYFM